MIGCNVLIPESSGLCVRFVITGMYSELQAQKTLVNTNTKSCTFAIY